MAVVGMLCQRLASHTLKSPAYGAACAVASQNSLLHVRFYNVYKLFQPKPEEVRRNLRFKVHYPEDGKYTVRPLKMTKLGGRDPDTGRIIHGSIGGGHKRNYRWVDFVRTGPTDGTFLEERILSIVYDPNRDARIALVGSGERLRYLIATDNMEKGDLIKTSSYIPRIPVRPSAGDAYPLGALTTLTVVCCVETTPGEGARLAMSAGTSVIVKRKMGNKVVIQLPSKKEMAVDANCMATVGRVSNVDHGKEHIGSAQRNRWFGNRPRSGLWQRKDGYQGRKIKALPPVKIYVKKKKEAPIVMLTLNGEGPPRTIIPSTDRLT